MWRLCLLLALSCVPALLAQPARTEPAPSPDEAVAAFRNGAAPAFLARVEEALRRELALKKPADAAIIRLAALRTFARRVAAAKLASPDDVKTAEWLVKQPILGPLFLTGLSPLDHAGRSVAVLAALRARSARAVEQFPELAVATCLVWDTPNREGQTPEQARDAACDVFEHLVQNRRSLRGDPTALPWQVLVYLVDSRIGMAERRWALESYRLPAEPGRAYFSVRYDWSGFESGQWKGGSDRQNYTLPNILRLGGVCKDQAYFAAETCRAYGIPATVCTGQSGEGEGFHAWVGLLRFGRSRPQWDFETARYAEHGFWSGTVIDPQTGQKLTDGEVAMSAEWCGDSRDKRLLSMALFQSLDLVEPARRIQALKDAIAACPANRPAWLALAAECQRPQTPAATLKEVAAVTERFAVGHYDEFAFKILTLLISGREPDEQLATLDRATQLFPERPDLLADLALRRGDVLAKSGRPVDALKTYERVLDEAIHYGPLVLEAMGRIDQMLRSAGKMKELQEAYRAVWRKIPAPPASGYIWTTPWYIMGQRYARALEESGDKSAAADVLKTLRAKDLSQR